MFWKQMCAQNYWSEEGPNPYIILICFFNFLYLSLLYFKDHNGRIKYRLDTFREVRSKKASECLSQVCIKELRSGGVLLTNEWRLWMFRLECFVANAVTICNQGSNVLIFVLLPKWKVTQATFTPSLIANCLWHRPRPPDSLLPFVGFTR